MKGRDLEDRRSRLLRLEAEDAGLREALRIRAAESMPKRRGPSVPYFVAVATGWSGTLAIFARSDYLLHSMVNGMIAGMVIALSGAGLGYIANRMLEAWIFRAVITGRVGNAGASAVVILAMGIPFLLTLAALIGAPIWVAIETGRQGIEFIWAWSLQEVFR